MEKKKECPKCGIKKTIDYFTKSKSRKDGFGSFCLECGRKYGRLHYKNNKAEYIKRISSNKERVRDLYITLKKSYVCSKCGDNRWYVLDFHHEGNKESDIAHMASEGYSIDSIKKEIEKCIVLCSNCHRELHYKQNGGIV